MSVFGEEIIDRLPLHSNLRKEDNPVRRVIIDTIGEWLDNYAENNGYESVFLVTATGGYLDRIGQDFSILRRIDESDEHYRTRIIYEKFGRLTVPYLKSVYDLELFVNVDDFNVTDDTLTSDNPFINDAGFMASADESTKNILNKKFILGSGITWL